jgi:hypothetical protein
VVEVIPVGMNYSGLEISKIIARLGLGPILLSLHLTSINETNNFRS